MYGQFPHYFPGILKVNIVCFRAVKPKAKAMVCGRPYSGLRVMLETAWLSTFEKETVMVQMRTHHKMVCPLFDVLQTVLILRQSVFCFVAQTMI